MGYNMSNNHPHLLPHMVEEIQQRLAKATIWKYPVKEGFNSIRVPRGSRILHTSKDLHGRPAVAVEIVDPLAECETHYIRVEMGSSELMTDPKARGLGSISEHYYAYWLPPGHPSVVKHYYQR